MLLKSIFRRNNWANLGYLIYLYNKLPIEYNNTTIIKDESVDYQPNRPTLYNRCLLGDGSSTVDLSSGIIGTLTLKGWVKYAPYKMNTTADVIQPLLRCTVTDDGNNKVTVTNTVTGTADCNPFINASNFGWLSKMNNGNFYYEYEIKSDDNLFVQLRINNGATSLNQESSTWVKRSGRIGGAGSTEYLYFIINNNGASYNAGTTVEIRNIKVWWENDGTELTEWAYIDDLPLKGSGEVIINDYTTVPLPNNSYYKSIERYDNEVKKDTAVCEEGAGTTLYFNSGDTAAITTANINLVRVTQDDAPLLAESGDIVGYYDGRYFDGTTSYVRVLSTLMQTLLTGDFTMFVKFSNLDLAQAGFNYVFNMDDVFLARYGSATPNRWAFGNFFGWCIFEFTTTANMEFYVVHDTSEVGMDRYKIYLNGVYQTRIGVDGIYNQPTNDTNPVILGARNAAQGWLRFTLEEFHTYTGIIGSLSAPIDSYRKVTNYINEVNGDIPSVNTTLNLTIPKLLNANTDIDGNALTYTGRKDQPLQVGGVAVNLDTTRNKEIQCSQSLTGVTVTAVYGEVAITGEQIQIADIGIDTVNDKLYNANVSGYDIKLARIDLSNGTQLVYLGGRDNNGNEIASDKMYDASQVDGVVGTIIYDTQDYHTSQKYYNHWVLYGASLALAYEIDPTHTVSNTSINTYAYTSQRRYDSFRWKALLLQSDTSGTLETGQEWQSGKFVIKKNGTLQGTSSRILIQIDLILDASNFNFKVDITGDKGIDKIEGEDRSIYTSFYSLMSSTYSITFTDSSHVTNFQEFYWLLAADDPNNDGTGWTPGVGQDPNDYPDIVLGITGASCSGVRTLLNQAGISDVLKFIELFNTSGVRTTYAADIFWYLLLRIKVNYSFPSLLGEGTHTISVTTNQLLRTTSISTARDIGYFLLYDRTPLQYIGLAIYDNTIAGNCQFDFHYLNINSLDLLTGLTDGSNTDSVGLLNKYPYGIHLNNTQKQYVQLPPFKTLEYAYQSNEEYWRDKVDTQGNAVIDRHLVPINLEHSDKGFPCLDLTSTDRDFAEITEINIENNKSYKFTILYNQVIDNGGNTFFGRRNSGNTAIGAFFNDSYYLILNSSPITVATDLDVSELRDFIHTVTFDVVAGNITNINFQIIKDGVVLSNKTTSDFTPSTLSAFDVLFAYSTNTAPTAAVRCKFSYAKIEVDNVLTHFWTYTGNNSLLLQDKVGGNHGILTTANVVNNQGVQDVYDPFEDGFNEFYYFFNNTNQQYIQVNYTKIDVVGEYFEVRFKPFSTGVVAASGSIYYISIAGGTGYITIYSSPSAQSLTTTNLSVNINEWNVLRIQKAAIGFDITLNGVIENHTTIEHYWMAGIGAYSLASINGIFDYVDAGSNGYWRDSNNWIDEVNSNNGVIYNPVKTKIIPKLPYNGQDIFGNPLTTPRTSAVQRAINFTK